ncbi:MAG: YaaA family protein [Prevotella sp.]
MQILLACAKTMDDVPRRSFPYSSVPYFQHEAQRFALEMTGRPIEELQEMFACSGKVALQALQRYQNFTDEKSTLPALIAYHGQAFRCLDATNLTDKDLIYAQQHLWITSFLYGLLRPADTIHPYRMEGRIALEATNGLTLFDYWKPLLTNLLIESVVKDDGILLHLATKEMERLFNWKHVKENVKLIQPQFLMERKGKLAAVSVYAKSCRGAMTRFAIKNRISNPDDLQQFEYEGFKYAGKDWLFINL